ncbi:MAG TPA: nitrile hydratase subunit alpha [Stellaceae bacterium]|nr:nitrile hydratase subunit alpha [Stellaceae bacterium]
MTIDHHDHEHGHDHGHDHEDNHGHHHPTLPDEAGGLSQYQVMEIAVRELLIEKGVFGAADVRRAIEAMDGRHAGLGASFVARAWVDPAFKARALADGSAAARELGLEIGPTRLIVVENTQSLHNLVVCTLCSCYPRMLLGLPPDWYKSRAYRSRAVHEPRAVLAEFGTPIAEDVELRVHDSTADMRYLVMPLRPAGTEALDEAALAALVTRDSMIGVALAETP